MTTSGQQRKKVEIMKLTIGRIVFYVLTGTDADQINQSLGLEAAVERGQIFPMMVTLIPVGDGAFCNGLVFLDGDFLWVRHIDFDPDATPGTWHWPPRV